MAIRLRPSVVASLLLLAAPAPALVAECKMSGLAQFPVTMRRMQPTIPAKINGTDVNFVVDSGAFFSILSPASAAAMNLPKVQAPSGFVVNGVGGRTQPMIATVRDFGLGGAIVNNMEFIVTGSSFGESVGLLGQNVFSFADTEYDLGGGAIRLLSAENCKDAARAYWVKPGERFSTVAIRPVTKFESHLVGTAYLNGKKIRVIFDTGAAMSMLSLHAAERAGVKSSTPGTVEAGHIRGIGARIVPTWIAPFASFKIGEEEIRNTRLRFGDIDLNDADMLLGADFFLSHRIYVATQISKVLFTYRGGPVFDLGSSAATESIVAPNEVAVDVREPADAQGYSRRGAVYAARGDMARAIADLNKAIELAPTEAEYFYQRGKFYQDSRQSVQALGDFDQAIKLKSDHLAARLARGGLRLARLEATGMGSADDIIADADVARSVATATADVHYDLGRLYAGAGAQAQVMAEFDLWLPAHRDDSRAADAHAFACRARAVLGQDINQGLSHCNSAVQDRPGIPFPLEARGLVYLRLQNFDKAITDFDKVLAMQPRNVWALYGRGLAKIGNGATGTGAADIASAKAVNPRIVSNAISRGFVP